MLLEKGSPVTMERYLLVRSGSIVCAIPAREVSETMRPLPTESISGMLPFVRGLSVIRGRPTPVIDLTAVLEGSAPGAVTRFVTLKGGGRPVALAVEEVIGIRDLAADSLESIGLVLDERQSDLVRQIGALDERVLMVLRTSRVVQEASA